MNAPAEYYCPISLLIMTDPVICLPCGHTFERIEIEKCEDNPLTRVKKTGLAPNLALKSLIDQYLKDHPEAQKDVYTVPQKVTEPLFDIAPIDVINLIQNQFRFVNLNEATVTKRTVAMILLSLYSRNNTPAPDVDIDRQMITGQINNDICEGDLVYLITLTNRDYMYSTAVLRSHTRDQCVVDIYDNDEGRKQITVSKNNVSFKRKTTQAHYKFFVNFDTIDLFNTRITDLDSHGEYKPFIFAVALINDVMRNYSQPGIVGRPQQNDIGEFVNPHLNPRFGDIVYLTTFEEQRLGIVIEVNEQVGALWHTILICKTGAFKKIAVSAKRMSFKRQATFQEINLMRLCGVVC